MNSTFSRTLMLVAVLCVSFTAAQAAEVRLTDGQLIVAGVDDSIGLGGFDVVLSYGTDVSITSVEPLSGFLVAENIRNDKGMTIIAGISTEGLTGDIPVASVGVEGTGPITISVRDLGNTRGIPSPSLTRNLAGQFPLLDRPSRGARQAVEAAPRLLRPRSPCRRQPPRLRERRSRRRLRQHQLRQLPQQPQPSKHRLQSPRRRLMG